ncbi:MAG: LD-carboxypeptidase [Thermoanaerobaculales bacterium]|nr:LD-carboxypeptidase [Thermoanaerobaculales bacterium]
MTALMNPLVARGGAIQIHGPVVTELSSRGQSVEDLRDLLEGRNWGLRGFHFDGDRVLRHGLVSGPVFGGNLTLFAALAGTPFSVSMEGKVLFLEEVREPPYRFDRLLTQLRSSGIFDGVKALISGDLHDCEAGAKEEWRRLLLEVAPAGVPVVCGLPFGHGKENVAFPIGAPVEVNTQVGHLLWRD